MFSVVVFYFKYLVWLRVGDIAVVGCGDGAIALCGRDSTHFLCLDEVRCMSECRDEVMASPSVPGFFLLSL